jgi:hypothetical protein
MTVETSVSPLVGANTDRRTTVQEFKLGTPMFDTKNRSWVYCQAAEAVATGTCTASAAWALTDAAGTFTADTAFASGEYGWVRLTDSPLE